MMDDFASAYNTEEEKSYSKIASSFEEPMYVKWGQHSDVRRRKGDLHSTIVSSH